MENSHLTPLTLSSKSSCDGYESPIVANQRSSKRRRGLAYLPDPLSVQLPQQRETSARLIVRAEPPVPARYPDNIGSFDGKGMGSYKQNAENKGVQLVQQSVYSTMQGYDAGDAKQQEMNSDIISQLVEMADGEPRLMHLVEVLFGGTASLSEREEWNRCYNSLSPSLRRPEAVRCKEYTGLVVERQRSAKAIPVLSEPLHSIQPSKRTSFHISGPVSNELSPPYSPTGPHHEGHPTLYSQEDEVLFLNEKSRTPRKQSAASDGAGIENSPLFVSPGKPLVVKKKSVAPTADPFAQAKRKRAQTEAELKETEKASGNSGTEKYKVVGRPILQALAPSSSRGPASQQILSMKVQNLEGCIAEYQKELQRKDSKIRDLGAEIDRAKFEHRLGLRKSKQQLAGLKTELEESHKAAIVAQTKFRELRLKMERTPRPLSANEPSTVCATQDATNIELSNLRSEVSALRSLMSAKGKPYPKYEFVHRNLFLAPLVLYGGANTVSKRGRGRPPKSISSLTGSDAGMNSSGYDEEHKEEEDTNLTRNERALREFDKAIGLPENPIPVRVDGMLAYRDGTRDANGRLPRAKNLFKVGRNVPGELK
ncbi:hypothetical protein MMC18_002079 [Xylographa bjoerkii]|nr:hypothetical protein [Xylographa bjoerkii]